jgi:hypothetical protein
MEPTGFIILYNPETNSKLPSNIVILRIVGAVRELSLRELRSYSQNYRYDRNPV